MKPFLMKFAITDDQSNNLATRVTEYAVQHEILVYKETSNFEPVIDDMSFLRLTGTTATFAHQDPSRDEDTDR